LNTALSRRAVVLMAGAAIGAGAVAADDEALLREIRAGAVLLMRHTQTAPGVGDPPGWRLSDCASQRNLDAQGIAHARRIGDWFKARQLKFDIVRNSPWCRTRDTAHLAAGRSDDWPALGNLFEDRSRADAQAAEVRRWIAGLKSRQRALLVSHGSTIGQIVPGATGMAVGEAAVVRASGRDAPPTLIGRLRVP
jgi:phosphohistidine phosphatase SixA